MRKCFGGTARALTSTCTHTLILACTAMGAMRSAWAQTFTDTNLAYARSCDHRDGEALAWVTDGRKLGRVRFADGKPAAFSWVDQVSVDGVETTFGAARFTETWMFRPSAALLIQRVVDGRETQSRNEPSPPPFVPCAAGTAVGDLLNGYLASKGLPRAGTPYAISGSGSAARPLVAQTPATPATPVTPVTPAMPAAPKAAQPLATPAAQSATATRHPALVGSQLKSCADFLRLWDRIWAGYPERRCAEQAEGDAALLLHGKTNQWRQYRYWPAQELIETSTDGNWAHANFLSAYSGKSLALRHAAIARLGPERVRVLSLLQVNDNYNSTLDEGVAGIQLNMWRRVQAHDPRAYVEMAEHLGDAQLPLPFEGLSSAADYLGAASQRGLGDATFKLAAYANSGAEQSRLKALALRQGSALAQREQAEDQAEERRMAQLRRHCSGRPAVSRNWLERTANELRVAPTTLVVNRVAISGGLCKVTLYHPRGALQCEASFDGEGNIRDCS